MASIPSIASASAGISKSFVLVEMRSHVIHRHFADFPPYMKATGKNRDKSFATPLFVLLN